MTEKEEVTFKRRKAKFDDENYFDSKNLANQMMNRGKDEDDKRRLCFECQNLVGKNCIKLLDSFKKPSEPLKFTLQNCVAFKLKGIK